MGGAELRTSDPVVSFRETVIGTSDHVVMSKSPNKHNRLYFQARPLEDGLAEAIDEGKVKKKPTTKKKQTIALTFLLSISTQNNTTFFCFSLENILVSFLNN